MSFSISGIKGKLDTALSGVSGIVSHYTEVPSLLNPPCAFPALRPTDSITYDFTAQNASAICHFYVEVLVSKGTSLEQAQDDLDPFLQNSGTTSIKSAIEAISWGTTADTCRVTNVSNYGPAVYGGTEYLGARLNLDIWV